MTKQRGQTTRFCNSDNVFFECGRCDYKKELSLKNYKKFVLMHDKARHNGVTVDLDIIDVFETRHIGLPKK